MKERLIRFMQGGTESTSYRNFSLFSVWSLYLYQRFSGTIPIALILYLIGWLLVIYCYFRVFSRNVSKRYSENQTFLAKTYGIRNFFQNRRILWRSRERYIISIHARHVNRRSVYRKEKGRLKCAARNVELHLLRRADHVAKGDKKCQIHTAY